MAHPEIPHGAIRVGFTPDEEIGRGANRFDVERFGAVCAYTLDGGNCGELEFESFSADAMRVTFIGFNTHPGLREGPDGQRDQGGGALRRSPAAGSAVAGDHRRIRGLRASRTRSRRRWTAPPSACCCATSSRAACAEKQQLVERIAGEVAAATGTRVEFEVDEQYRNMREILDQHPDVVERARAAIRRAGLTPIEKPIRGGTDGSRLSFMGLPTPNLFAGEHNFHSRLEWTSRQDLERAAAVIVELARVWGER